ncbi:MAG TPA: HAD-IIA family hydrolase [Acidimicrobiales bacterium]|nr:HAD-IIA family hydrolase [Acidimicrobiales bacterium]
MGDSGGGTWVIDLDGVVWLAQEPIAGSADAVARLRRAGINVLFATNNALPTLAELVAQLAAVGIPAEPSDLVTSAQAAASMLVPGSTAVVCAGGGVREALADRHVTVVAEGPADAVVVGLTRQFDFAMLATAAATVRAGARLVGTNEDATYPTPAGLLPGAGALLASVATAAQTTPDVAGKPHEPIVALLADRAPDARMVVGDRPSTDGLLARRLGVAFALVRSGVTGPAGSGSGSGGPMVVEPEIDAADLADVVDRFLAS